MSKICRTCSKEIINTTYFYMNTVQDGGKLSIQQKLNNCIPELDLSIIPNCTICQECSEAIDYFNKFKQKCVQFEMQINKYMKQMQHSGDIIDLREVVHVYRLKCPNPDVKIKVENCKISDCESDGVLNNAELYQSHCQDYDMKYELEDYNLTELQTVTDSVNVAEVENTKLPIKYETEESLNKKDDKLCKENNFVTASDDLYKCLYCDYKNYSQRNLQKHLWVHTKDKSFKCSMCSYKSTYRSNLKAHLRTHTQEKPFHCSLCDYRCNYSNALKIHLRTHTPEKLFKCTMCTYRSNQTGHLKSHMRIHTLERPYKCSVCAYRANHKGHLTRHMRTHTQKQDT